MSLTSRELGEIERDRREREQVAAPTIRSPASVRTRIESADSESERRSLKLIADLLNAAKSLPVYSDPSSLGNPSKAVLDKVRAAGWRVEASYGQRDSSLVFHADGPR